MTGISLGRLVLYRVVCIGLYTPDALSCGASAVRPMTAARAATLHHFRGGVARSVSALSCSRLGLVRQPFSLSLPVPT